MILSQIQHFKSELPSKSPSIFFFWWNQLTPMIVSAVWIIAGYLMEIWYILKYFLAHIALLNIVFMKQKI